MILLFLLLADADTRLAEVRAHFSVAALEDLARQAKGSEAGGQAAAWRGALAKQAGDLDGAAGWFELAMAAPAAGEARRQAARGLGDVELTRHRYAEARARYQEASLGASAILTEELAQKAELARRLGLRQRWEWCAWAFLTAAFGYFVARAWRGRGRLPLPLEAVYVLPVYALLVGGAVGRDPAVTRALAVAGTLSLLFIAAAGVASRRAPPTGRLRYLQAALLVTGNLALFYAVLNRTGLVDTLVVTAQL